MWYGKCLLRLFCVLTPGTLLKVDVFLTVHVYKCTFEGVDGPWTVQMHLWYFGGMFEKMESMDVLLTVQMHLDKYTCTHRRSGLGGVGPFTSQKLPEVVLFLAFNHHSVPTTQTNTLQSPHWPIMTAHVRVKEKKKGLSITLRPGTYLKMNIRASYSTLNGQLPVFSLQVINSACVLWQWDDNICSFKHTVIFTA